MATPYNFWVVMHHFVRRESFGKTRGRGYWTDGTDVRLNGHRIAHWHNGAVRMYLTDPQWHKYMVATAIQKIAEYCADHGVLAAPDGKPRMCREHPDCLLVPRVAKWCAASRPPSKPPEIPLREKKHDFRLHACPHKRKHRRWESCLAARNVTATKRIAEEVAKKDARTLAAAMAAAVSS